MNPAVISELLAGAKCFQCLTPRQRNRLNAYLLSRQSPGPGPGPDPEPPIDPSACAVEDVTDGGGDTFDCYNEGVFTTLPRVGPWTINEAAYGGFDTFVISWPYYIMKLYISDIVFRKIS